MKRKIYSTFLVILMIFLCFSTVEAKAPERYFENNLFEYGSTYTLTDGTGTISSSNSSIARVSGNTVSIAGTGHFTLTITVNGESKSIKCFAWNVCLKNGKTQTYSDANKSNISEVLYAKTYLSVSSSGSMLKVNDYLCTTGSYRGDLKGRYIANEANKDGAKNFDFCLSPSSTAYDGTLRSLGFEVDTESTDPSTTNPTNKRATITVQYRKYTEGGEGQAISGITDIKKSITQATTIRRDKNAEVLKKGYTYRGVSIDGGDISANSVISANIDTSNQVVTFWYDVRESMPEKITQIDLSALTPSQQNYGMDLSNLTSLNAMLAGKIIANCAMDQVNNHNQEWTYSQGLDGNYGQTDGVHNSIWGKNCNYNSHTYKEEKSTGWAYGLSYMYNGPHHYFSNKYCTNCEGFCNSIIHWALGIGGETYTYFTHNYFTKLSGTPPYLTAAYAKTMLMPGDIVVYSGHLALYVGDGKVAENNLWGIKIRSAVRTDKALLGVYRISEATAASVDVSKLNPLYLSGIGPNIQLASSNENVNANKPIYPHTFSGTLVDSYNDSSIDVKIEKYNRFYIVKVWLKDPSQQIRKAEAGWGVQLQQVPDMLDATSDAIVGVNGGSFYLKGAWEPESKAILTAGNWNKTASGHYVISNGIVRRKLEGTVEISTIGFTKAGTLKYYEYNPMSDLDNDGIFNTFTFRPLLIKDGQKYTVTNPNLKATNYNNKRGRTTVGQVDENNYIIIMASDNPGSQVSLGEIIPIGLELKCKILFNLDGGGSSALWLRKGRSGAGRKVAGGTRSVADALYFKSIE